MRNGSLAMSYNMIDFTIFDKVECSAESHYHRTYSCYQKYVIRNINFFENRAEITIKLLHLQSAERNTEYAESVVYKTATLIISKLYDTPLITSFFRALEIALNAYYIVELVDGEIHLTAKIKCKVPNILIPEIEISGHDGGISFEFHQTQAGFDTTIHVPNHCRNIVHLPRTTFGDGYSQPKVGDRLIFIDSVNSDRDRTFTREVIGVTPHAACTCDVLTLDFPIDRMDDDLNRLSGLGLQRPVSHSNGYTASFDSVKVYKQKSNYAEILEYRGEINNECIRPFIDNNYANMKDLSKSIIQKFLVNSENPHLHHSMSYFGAHFKWYDFEEELRPIWDQFGEYLCEDLFLLTSNKHRPEYLVHIDYDFDDPTQPVVGSLTWPVLNCNKNTVTVWYSALKSGTEYYGSGNQTSVITDESITLIEKDRFYFDTTEFNPAVFKHCDWHTLYNSDNVVDNRMLLQWRFKPNLTWDEILNITQILWRNHDISQDFG